MTISDAGTAVGEGLGVAEAVGLAVLGDALWAGDAVKVAVTVGRAAAGTGVLPRTGTKPAPPLGDGWRLAGISEQATTIAASNAVTNARRPTERGCYRRRSS